METLKKDMEKVVENQGMLKFQHCTHPILSRNGTHL